MKRMTTVPMLLITILLSITGCAQNEAVKKDDGLGSPLPQKAVLPLKDMPSQAKSSSSSTPSSTEVHTNQIAPAADSLQGASAQQTTPVGVVYFGFDSYVLTTESGKTLQASFNRLANRPYIQIEGHCDEQGSSEYNLALGEKRAKAAQNYLVTLGYPADRIATISYGKERPADRGHDEAAWAKNRRDELKIVR